jgi:pimeloyl-ACP methyl ester carboxylesterase
MVTIDFDSKGDTVYGKFAPGKGALPRTTVLLVPGFPGGEQDVLGLAGCLSQRGINALFFNYRGTYRSEGTLTLDGSLEDVGAAMEYLHRESVVRRFQIDPSRIVLGGYSHGGGLSLIYAAAHPEIRRVFSIAGNDFGEFARQYRRDPAFAAALDKEFRELEAPSGPVRYGDEVPPGRLLEDPDPYDLRLHAPALADRDLLLVGGWDDPGATIEHYVLPLYRALCEAGAQHVRIEALQDDHDFASSGRDLADLLARWVTRQ